MNTATAARQVPRRPPDEEENKLTPATLGVPPSTDLVIQDFGDGPDGLEGMTLGEQLTPFLRMLQGLSPELNRSKAEYVPGAELGMIINTATKELYLGAEGLDVVICAREYGYGQWIPRDLGGGFRGALAPDDPLVRETLARMAAKYGSSAKFKMPRYRDGRWSDPPARTRDTDEEVELVETGQLYLLYARPGELTADTAARAIVAMTSTALPVYQGVLTRHNSWKWPQSTGPSLRAKLWAYVWRLTTRQDGNKKGEFMNWNLNLAAATNYRQAHLLLKANGGKLPVKKKTA